MGLDHRNKVLRFLHGQKLAVIATTNLTTPSPESALIAFAEDEHLQLYFQTGMHTRKAANLRINAHISLVFGLTMDDHITVQYEGIAQHIVSADELELCKQRFVTKNSPTTEHYFNHPTTLFFKVIPTWIGYSDYSGDTPEVFEIKQF